jgi:transposase
VVGIGEVTGLVVGVDTHRDTHTAAVCDRSGQALARQQFAASPEGYAEVLAWARRVAGEAGLRWAIEGTRHYGLGLARHLAAAGEHAGEIDASRHAGKRRGGKSDAIDAVRAARELLARPAPAHMRAHGLAGDAENGYPDVEADFIERLVMRVFDELVEVGARGGRAGSSVHEVDVRADARRR